jgi:hypothetical protein
MSADYFPIETAGNSWEFERDDGVRLLVLASGEAVRGDRECYLVERNYSPEYWYEDSRELARYEMEYYDIGGQRVEFDQWLRYLELPLVAGNCWSDTMDVVKTVLGEKVRRRVVYRGKVEGIEAVQVKAGRFRECYRIGMERMRETFVESVLLDADTTYICEWYAPDAGLVKFSEDGQVYSLIRLVVHP